MPFNIGPGELIVVLIIALIVVGPGKLPDVGAALGKSIREFRRAAADVKETTSMETAAPTTTAPTSTPAPTAQVAAPAAPAPAVPTAPPAVNETSEPVAVAAAADAEEQTSA